MYVIRTIGPGSIWHDAYVTGFNNTLGCITIVYRGECAMQFATEDEAYTWAKRYCTAHNYKVVEI